MSVVPSIGKVDGLAVNVWPATVNMFVGDARAMLEVPMARIPDVASETGVPEMMTSDPPAVMVMPLIETADGAAVKVCPPVEKTDAETVEEPGRSRVTVELPIIAKPGRPSERRVPAIVITGAPGVSVVLSMAIAIGSTVILWPLTVKMEEMGENAVPEIVIFGASDVSV